MGRRPVSAGARVTPLKTLSEPGLVGRSNTGKQDPHPEVSCPPTSPGAITKDIQVLLTETITLVARIVIRRSGLQRIQREDLVHESLVLLLAQDRQPAFWNALRPTAAGSDDASAARRAVVQAIDRALWRLRDLRKVRDRTAELLLHEEGGTRPSLRKRVLVPKHQNFPDDGVLVDPHAVDFECVDRCIDVWNALGGLEPQLRQAVLSRVVDCDTWTTIARRAGSSEKHIQKTVRRALSDLSSALRSYKTPERRVPGAAGHRI